METDEELVRKARSGDVEAFGALIERHQQPVAGFLISVLHDMDSAEDAAQLAFVKAWEGLASFEGRSSFKTWVSRIALNIAKSRMRWERLRRWLPLDAPRGEDGDGWEESVRSAATGSDEQDLLERKLELERAMGALAPREREVAALRLEGYSLGEIAQVLRVSAGTVKSTLFAATRKMRLRLS